MRFVTDILIFKRNEIPSLKKRYKNGLQNIIELSDLFKKLKDVCWKSNPKIQYTQIWQTFVHNAQIPKYKIPLNIDNTEHSQLPNGNNATSIFIQTNSSNASIKNQTMNDDNNNSDEKEQIDIRREKKLTNLFRINNIETRNGVQIW